MTSSAEQLATASRALSDTMRSRREYPTRGNDLVRVLNAHGGIVCDIEPGATGLVNTRNSAVASMIAAGMLVRVDATDEKSAEARANVDATREMSALREALSRAETEAAEREQEMASLRAEVLALRSVASNVPMKDARIAELEAELAHTRADLDAATTPSVVSPSPGASPTPSKVKR